MTHNTIDFANLTDEQLNAIKGFEDEFNSKYSSHIYIMAFGNK